MTNPTALPPPTTQPSPPQKCPHCGASIDEDPISPPQSGDWRMCVQCERPLRYTYNPKTEELTLRSVSYGEFQDAPPNVQGEVFRTVGWLRRGKDGGGW